MRCNDERLVANCLHKKHKCTFDISIGGIEKRCGRAVIEVKRTDMCLPVAGCIYVKPVKHTCLIEHAAVICFSIECRIVYRCIPILHAIGFSFYSSGIGIGSGVYEKYRHRCICFFMCKWLRRRVGQILFVRMRCPIIQVCIIGYAIRRWRWHIAFHGIFTTATRLQQ